MWLVAIVPIVHHKKFISEARPFTTRIYVPMIRGKRKVRHKNNVVDVMKPAFGSYMFVKIRHGQWDSVSGCKGFKSYVNAAGDPLVMQARSIKNVKALEKINFGFEMFEVANFAIGDDVRSANENMQNIIGKIIELPGKGKIVIAVNGIRVTMDIDKAIKIT